MRPASEDDIVISGISGRYPKSASLQEFWDNLTNAAEMYTEETKRWNTSMFFSKFVFCVLNEIK